MHFLDLSSFASSAGEGITRASLRFAHMSLSSDGIPISSLLLQLQLFQI